MLFSEKHYMRLKKALISAYNEKEKVEVDDFWQKGAMRRIRQIDPTPVFTISSRPHSQCRNRNHPWRGAYGST